MNTGCGGVRSNKVQSPETEVEFHVLATLFGGGLSVLSHIFQDLLFLFSFHMVFNVFF